MNWLLKEEPSNYNFEALTRDGRTSWTGVRNPVAQRNLRAMKKGDRVFFYHTGEVKAIVGIATVLDAPYPDPGDKAGTLWAVDIGPVRALAAPVTLKAVKADPRFAEFVLARVPRLSVMPVTDEQWSWLEAMSHPS
jgi:predicted RNA-binding protein with PUA-like domain